MTNGSSRRNISARRGGPATFSGANYQLAVAVSETLRLLGQLGWQPHLVHKIGIEPRVIRADVQLGFDIRIADKARYLEAKLKPTRKDVKEWLVRIRMVGDLAGPEVFEFVHGASSLAASDLEELCRIAGEAADASEFDQDVDERLNEKQRSLATLLGPNCYDIARRILVRHLPPEYLRREIENLALLMYGPNPGREVIELLSYELAQAAERRTTLSIGELSIEINDRGISLNLAGTSDAAGLSEEARAALVILQACESPLPIEVLGQATGREPEQLLEELEGLLVESPESPGDTILVGLRPMGPVSHPRESMVLGEALRVLCAVARVRGERAVAVSQVRNMLSLARKCLVDRPDLVSEVFPAAEKAIKILGDMHLTLRSARLSLDASQRISAAVPKITEDMLRNRAQTLICGLSWVYQRVGLLNEADRHAQESLELGKTLGWARNTAFCFKCRGRLQRIRAELSEGEEREAFLAGSRELLEAAIDAFARHPEFGPEHPEVADCRSLLGRTLLVQERLDEAAEAVRIARGVLDQEIGSKDWADVLILNAEIRSKRGQIPEGIGQLTKVLEQFDSELDADATEIAARALVARAKLWEIEGQRQLAIDDLERAAEHFERLEDQTTAWGLRQELIRLRGRLPERLTAVLNNEPLGVAVEAVDLLKDQLGQNYMEADFEREELGPWLTRLVEMARIEAARKRKRWA